MFYLSSECRYQGGTQEFFGRDVPLGKREIDPSFIKFDPKLDPCILPAIENVCFGNIYFHFAYIFGVEIGNTNMTHLSTKNKV